MNLSGPLMEASWRLPPSELRERDGRYFLWTSMEVENLEPAIRAIQPTGLPKAKIPADSSGAYSEGNVNALVRKAAICSRVTGSDGQKSVSVQPVVTPSSLRPRISPANG